MTGTDNNDRIHIANGKDGGLEIRINGIKNSFTVEQASKLVIDAKAGDDIITADKDVKTGLFITGGSGNDIISGSSGNDFIIDSFVRNIIFENDGSDSIISFGLDTDGGSINRAGLEISGRPDAWAQRPSIVGLFHEFTHSYNAAIGTMDYGAYKYDDTKALDKIGLVGAEYQAVGIEHPLVNTNPDGLNENGMRSLLGIEKRTYY